MGVKGLGNGFDMNESAGKLEVQVGKGASGVVGRDTGAGDVLWLLNAQNDSNISMPPFLRLDFFPGNQTLPAPFPKIS